MWLIHRPPRAFGVDAHASQPVGPTTKPVIPQPSTAHADALAMAPEEGQGPKMSATSSEVASVLRHRAKKASWSNRVLRSRQRDALRVTDEHVKAVHLGVEDLLDVFVGNMEVRNSILKLNMIA